MASLTRALPLVLWIVGAVAHGHRVSTFLIPPRLRGHPPSSKNLGRFSFTPPMRLSRSEDDSETDLELPNRSSNNDNDVVFVDDSNIEDLPPDLQEEMEASKPSELVVMKELLGINVGTYILAAAIAFFLGMNTLLGPGWLGSRLMGNSVAPPVMLDGQDWEDTQPPAGKALDLSDPRYQTQQ